MFRDYCWLKTIFFSFSSAIRNDVFKPIDFPTKLKLELVETQNYGTFQLLYWKEYFVVFFCFSMPFLLHWERLFFYTESDKGDRYYLFVP